MLGSPAFWEYWENFTEKFWNWEGNKNLKSFFLECFFKNDTTIYIINVNLYNILQVIIMSAHRYNTIKQ